MPDTSPTTKKAFINRDFRDAGTETNFTASVAGKPETYSDIEEGAFGNYLAAGLVSEPDAANPANSGGKADA